MVAKPIAPSCSRTRPRARLALGRVLEQVGNRRHAPAGDVLQDLEHLAPLFELGDRKLGVPHRLLDELFTRANQAREPAAVGSFRGGLVLELAPRLRPVELGGRQVAKLLVGLEKLHLAVAHLERLALPLAQLLGDPDRVLLGIQDVERVTRRIGPRTAGEIIFGKEPEADGLRLDAQRLRRERAGDFHRLFIVATGGEDALAVCRRRIDRALDPLPLDADLLDAEVVGRAAP